MLQAVGVFAVAAIFGAAAGLHVGGFPWLGADGAQKRGGVAGARADFHVVGLEQGAALGVPVLLQFENDLLEGQHGLSRPAASWLSLDGRKLARTLHFTVFGKHFGWLVGQTRAA